MRDFTRDLTIMVAGTGKTTWDNLKENLDDWVFGKLGDPDAVNSREVKIIFPILHRSGPMMNLMTRYAVEFDADVQVIQTKDAAMNRDLSALPDIVRVDTEHEALSMAFSLLESRGSDGDEVVFLMAFDPASNYTQGQNTMSDLEIIYEAKEQPGLMTLSIDGMVDYFEGYESEEDRQSREMLEENFAAAAKAEQDRLKALEPAPAKKATAPRKRAAKKAVAPKPTEAPVEPEKAVQTPSQPSYEPSGIDEFVAKRAAEQNAKREAAKTELSATVSLKSAVPTLDELLGSDSVESDVSKYKFSMNINESRQDELLVELGENIAAMGEAFSNTIRTLTALIKERNV